MGFFVELALGIPLNQAEEGEEIGSVFGRRVQVPFGSRRLSGVVVGSSAGLPPECSVPEGKVRAVTRFIDASPLLTQELYDPGPSRSSGFWMNSTLMQQRLYW
mgnify:CR=1 FL=1